MNFIKNISWVSFIMGVVFAWFGMPLVTSLLGKVKGGQTA